MDELISRRAAIDALFELYEYQRDIDPTEAADLVRQGIFLAEKKIEKLPSAKPEPLKIHIDHALTEEEIKNLKQKIADSPIVLMPSAQTEQRWIPCSERLPEDYTDVLVWFEYFRYGDYNRLYQMYGIGSYIAEYDSWMINYETGWRKLRVIAWCPLPEPWKGEEHGTSRAVLSQKPVR